MLIEFFLIIFFNILILLSIKSTSKLVTSNTFKMQLSFYKTTLIDSIFVILFVWVPIVISPIIVISKISDFRVGILGFNSSIIGAPISYLLNMILIKPYRRFLISILRKIIRKEISESNVNKVQTVNAKLVVSRK
uniref:G-protein coupled receptors family 1 profile domain-containing protein n=1 Tax=Acrobeloides nanus TaxID=290746 RepID=A0A914D8Q5_9BILA